MSTRWLGQILAPHVSDTEVDTYGGISWKFHFDTFCFEWVTTIDWNPNLIANGFKLNMAKPSFQLDLQCLGAKQICFSIIQWSIDSHGRRNL